VRDGIIDNDRADEQAYNTAAIVLGTFVVAIRSGMNRFDVEDMLAGNLTPFSSAMAKPAKQAAMNAKEKSIAVARGTIGKIEEEVLRALDGENLLGLPNLGTARDTYHAVNVRAADPAKKFWRGDDKPTLIISRTGQLQVVTFGHDEIVHEDVDLEKLLPGDLLAVTERYKVALDLHLARCQDSLQRSEKVVSLARAIKQALETRKETE
jgi:hypothetical protein